MYGNCYICGAKFGKDNEDKWHTPCEHMNTIKLKPPRRFIIEMSTDDNGNETARLVECTGIEDPVYIVGLESPWLGYPLESIKKWANELQYGPDSGRILKQIEEFENA